MVTTLTLRYTATLPDLPALDLTAAHAYPSGSADEGTGRHDRGRAGRHGGGARPSAGAGRSARHRGRAGSRDQHLPQAADVSRVHPGPRPPHAPGGWTAAARVHRHLVVRGLPAAGRSETPGAETRAQGPSTPLRPTGL